MMNTWQIYVGFVMNDDDRSYDESRDDKYNQRLGSNVFGNKHRSDCFYTTLFGSDNIQHIFCSSKHDRFNAGFDNINLSNIGGGSQCSINGCRLYCPNLCNTHAKSITNDDED